MRAPATPWHAMRKVGRRARPRSLLETAGRRLPVPVGRRNMSSKGQVLLGKPAARSARRRSPRDQAGIRAGRNTRSRPASSGTTPAQLGHGQFHTGALSPPRWSQAQATAWALPSRHAVKVLPVDLAGIGPAVTFQAKCTGHARVLVESSMFIKVSLVELCISMHGLVV